MIAFEAFITTDTERHALEAEAARDKAVDRLTAATVRFASFQHLGQLGIRAPEAAKLTRRSLAVARARRSLGLTAARDGSAPTRPRPPGCCHAGRTDLGPEADLSNADTRKVIDAVVEAMTQAAIRGEEVTLPNFGKFKVKDVPAREGRNPATGATIQIAASRKLGFTPAKALKDALNGGK
ncbi:HU family DNA-binding protein [Komagataeibacter xylinus]|nr:HU family DNA-binding protein [Komagataeibacter xylinus]QOC48323.1 HU family DNA-binding protein [Komagataeibacter rhaeticus]